MNLKNIDRRNIKTRGSAAWLVLFVIVACVLGILQLYWKSEQNKRKTELIRLKEDLARLKHQTNLYRAQYDQLTSDGEISKQLLVYNIEMNFTERSQVVEIEEPPVPEPLVEDDRLVFQTNKRE